MVQMSGAAGANKVYFEKQGPDNLCGLHCLNAVFQGPYFDEVSLGQLAVNLDKAERALTRQDSMNFKSENVATDGMFSIQVLNAAVQSMNQQAMLINILSEDVKGADLIKEQAFIGNKGNHWFTIRKVHGVWYNCNSTNIVPPGPQFVSDMMLDAFLSSLGNGGFTIYTLRGMQL
jgi:ataxin-3